MTIPAKGTNDNIEGLPVAQGLWVSDEEHDTAAAAAGSNSAFASGLRAELLSNDSIATTAWGDQETQQQGKEKSSFFPWGKESSGQEGGGYSMTTGQGSSYQTYWGRFNDPPAQVLPDYGGDTGGDTIPAATARPDDRHIRLAFIRKVYMILSAQLLVTFGMCAWMALVPSVRTFTLETGAGTVLLYTNMVLMFVMICFLHAYKRTYPNNYIILSIFTVSSSYMVGFVTAAYEQAGAGDLVIEAVFITATVFIVLTIFTLQSKWDFSFMGAGLGMCLWIMILWGLFSMIFGFQTGSVYALLGSILFSAYIIYDTYMIAERLDPEDYIVAAIELYLDLINLFLYILQLLSDSRR